MSRLRAETMPAVTVPPRLNGLPIAITHSPSRSLSESPNFTALSGLSGLTLQQREIGLGVLADQLGLEPRAVVEDDGDLVGVGDHVIVGDDDAGRIDDEAGAERIDAARARVRRVLSLALAAAVEEVPEQLVELRIVAAAAASAVLRDSTFCEVEILTTASITCSATSAIFRGRARPQAVASAGKTSAAAATAAKAGRADLPGKLGKSAEHGRLSS